MLSLICVWQTVDQTMETPVIWDASVLIMTSEWWAAILLRPQYYNSQCYYFHIRLPRIPWASYQIHKIAGCTCAGNVGNVFPATDFTKLHKMLLEQLDRLRSENTPTAPWLPILLIHIRSQVKKIWEECKQNCRFFFKVKAEKNFVINLTRDTSSKCSYCLWQIWK